jgi:hypothetical protein
VAVKVSSGIPAKQMADLSDFRVENFLILPQYVYSTAWHSARNVIKNVALL